MLFFFKNSFANMNNTSTIKLPERNIKVCMSWVFFAGMDVPNIAL